jgi:hypothetical protein
MYSRQEVEALDVDGVVKFAQEQGLDQEDVAVLRKQKIDGSVLERLNMDKLMKAGMKMGPAEKLMKALDKVFGRGELTRLRLFFVLVSLLLLCCVLVPALFSVSTPPWLLAVAHAGPAVLLLLGLLHLAFLGSLTTFSVQQPSRLRKRKLVIKVGLLNVLRSRCLCCYCFFFFLLCLCLLWPPSLMRLTSMCVDFLACSHSPC